MSLCIICNCVFRDNWVLERHQHRKVSCKNTQKIVYEKQKSTIDTLVEQKSTLVEQKSTLAECKYCTKNFYNKGTMKRHSVNCKYRDDPVRLLEIEQNIEPVLPDCKTECRYCNKNLSRTSCLNQHLLVCKQKDDYHKGLLNQQQPPLVVNNNITNNNTNIENQNNNIILKFGSENMDHVQTEKIIQMIRDVHSAFKDNPNVYIMAGDLISKHDDYIREPPRNKNLIIQDIKSPYATIKNDQGWEKVSVDRCLNSAFIS